MNSLLYPMFCLVLLTTVVALMTLACRVKSVSSGVVKLRYYQLMQGDDAVPEIVTRTTRCANNLFEIPVLFYVVCTLYISLAVESTAALVLAWLFVGFRCVQAIIHLSYNNVLHRMSAFWGAFICMLLLWIVLLGKL